MRLQMYLLPMPWLWCLLIRHLVFGLQKKFCQVCLIIFLFDKKIKNVTLKFYQKSVTNFYEYEYEEIAK